MGFSRSLSDLTGKARIRHAALILFANDGYAQTSLRSIAREAGVSLALITHHFGSKHQLRAAVDEDVIDTFARVIQGVLMGAEQCSQHEVDSELADEVARLLEGRPELCAYLRRSVVIDGGGNGAALVNSLLASVRVLFERPGVSDGERDPAWQSLQFFLLILGPTLLEPMLHKSLPGIYTRKGSQRWHGANIQMLQIGSDNPARVPERGLRLVAGG